MPNHKQITLLQLDGKLNSEEFIACLNEGITGCMKVYEVQRSALMQKYFGNETELKE